MEYIVQPVYAAYADMPGVTPGKVYIIQATHSAMLASTRQGQVVVEQRAWTEQSRQQWTIELLSGDDSGYFRIVSVQSGKVLAVADQSTVSGAPIVESDWDGGHDQQWKLEHLGLGNFRITARHSDRVLDVEGASMQEGARLIQSEWHSEDSQRWRLSTVASTDALDGYDNRITLFEGANFAGNSREAGLGSYARAADLLGGQVFRSARVPQGLRFTLFSAPNFGGNSAIFEADVADVGAWEADSSLVVQSVVTVYEHRDYGGRSQNLPVGTYPASDLVFGDNALRSLRVPSGMVAYLYENSDFTGRVRIYTESAPYVQDDFNGIVSGVIVKMVGIAVPAQALKYGDKIGLQAASTRFLAADGDGALHTSRSTLTYRAEFAVVRVGASKLRAYVSYGDRVALQSADGRFVTIQPDGAVAATGNSASDPATFTVERSGSSIHNSFVSVNDTISLMSTRQTFLAEQADGGVRCDRTANDASSRWKVHARAVGIRHCPESPPSRVQVNDTARVTHAIGENLNLRDAPMGNITGSLAGGTTFTIIGGPECRAGYTWWQIRTDDGRTGWSAEGGGHHRYYFMEPYDPISSSPPPGDNVAPPSEGGPVAGGGVCGAEACNVDVCGAEACGVDVCDSAACLADALLIGVCGEAAGGLAVCAVDVAGVAACGAAAAGLAACGADLCGGAACALEACGGAACGAAACGVDLCAGALCGLDVGGSGVCGLEACGAVACAAEACAGEACPADVCAAEACGADVCGAEACAAEACAGEACSGDVCGTEACGAEACAAEACPVEACPADACAANVCAVNLCPADACAADACAIDLIPIIPGI
jgi:hypothetical protein